MKTRHLGKSIIVLFILLSISQAIFSCTTFTYKEDGKYLLYGRNFDYPISDCHLIVNKSNLAKRSLAVKGEKSLDWVSKYGSITFNQFGREFPYGGMNEAGLVIEVLEHRDARLPEPDGRFGVTELQWVQYQLDNCSSVKDVIATDKKIRVSKTGSVVPLHYMISDKSGNTAIFEYLDGKAVIHTGKGLERAVLANNTYSQSLQLMKKFKDFGGQQVLEKNGRSPERFAIACRGLDSMKTIPNKTDYAFGILKETDKENTQWSTVYDIRNMSIYVRSRENQGIKKVEFKDFNFKDGSSPLYADLNTDGKDGKLQFNVHTYNVNLKLLEISYEKLKRFVPVNIKYDEIAKYADSIKAVKK